VGLGGHGSVAGVVVVDRRDPQAGHRGAVGSGSRKAQEGRTEIRPLPNGVAVIGIGMWVVPSILRGIDCQNEIGVE
jgi:hypothetical protein